MRKNKVFFRVDGNEQIGLGHLVRCIALAEMLRNNYEISFACRNIPEATLNELEKLDFKLTLIENENQFFSLLDKDAIVVLDHYELGSTYQKLIKDKVYKLVCIDDLHEKLFYADLVINHSPGVASKDYKAQVYTQFALGLDYVLLRPAFLNFPYPDKKIKTIENLFVCFGGADYKNITQTVVEILKYDLRFKKIIIVTGSAYRYLNTLESSINSDRRFKLYHSIDSDLMLSLMQEGDLAIVPSSGILQEVLAVGLLAISGMYVENQKNIFENFKSLGAFINAEDFSIINIKSALDKSFEIRLHEGKRFIDRKSNQRILKSFSLLTREKDLVLTKLSLDHLIKTFEWANNKEIRRYSISKESINLETHTQWFLKRLDDQSCFYYIGSYNNVEFGSVRFDVKGSRGKISYLVDPVHQNNGLGTLLLKVGLDKFLKEKPDEVTVVWGEVFYENHASVKVFKRLGYNTESNESGSLIKFKKSLIVSN